LLFGLINLRSFAEREDLTKCPTKNL